MRRASLNRLDLAEEHRMGADLGHVGDAAIKRDYGVPKYGGAGDHGCPLAMLEAVCAQQSGGACEYA